MLGQICSCSACYCGFKSTASASCSCAGQDQTRGWFYTLMVLSTALFNKPAFKNLVCNGLVLADDGKKMSKRLKNYPVSCFWPSSPPQCFLKVSMCISIPTQL